MRAPKKHGVQPPHAPLERRAGAARHSPHAARHVHAYNRRAYGVQACRAFTPVQRACKACKPFGQACRLCTPVGSRKPLDSRGLREPRYPYKGTRTLIRVIRGYRGSRKPLESRVLCEPTGVQSLHALWTGVKALHACTPIVGVHMACSVWGLACSPCTPFQRGVQRLHAAFFRRAHARRACRYQAPPLRL
ncbi:hypothetical protein PCANC_19853 [Puccinia coronata f. sp. avenae]|uniref:Uncharacterized protein n=1 Tax=Puccinia coronata f. sp. avenae TaxID=200324 RepID=A0A2N5UC70_9BASI|nr:hypothetical protein PCANC_19853 [Puccinia coronata f. sp. avenae]